MEWEYAYSGPARVVREELIAYRGWRIHLVRGAWRLRSLYLPVTWAGPTLTANCVPVRQVVPYPTAVRSPGEMAVSPQVGGVYACKQLERAIQVTRTSLGCVGQVALTGTVIVGEHGYRAQRATIRSLLFLTDPDPDLRLRGRVEMLAKEFAEVYQVELPSLLTRPLPLNKMSHGY